LAKILVVDDHPTNRQVLVTLLGYGGHQSLEASDGAEALALARLEHPDLIITDILMPTMDGFEFVGRLRREAALSSIPVVFYTATYLEKEAQALARACGVRDVIVKPAEPQEVLWTIHSALHLEGTPLPDLPASESAIEPMQVIAAKLAKKVGELDTVGLRLAALVELGIELGGERDPLRLLEGFTAGARKVIGARYAALSLVGEDGDKILVIIPSGVDPETAAHMGHPPMGAGIFGEMLRERRPLRLRDVADHPLAAALPPGHPPVTSFLGVPVETQERLYGLLYLTSKIGAEEFSEEDERIARTLSAQVAVAYENAIRYEEIQSHSARLQLEIAERVRAEEETRQRLEELEVVNRVSTALRAASTLGEMLPALLRDTISGMRAESGGIWLHDSKRGRLSRVAEQGSRRNGSSASLRGDAIAENVFSTGTPHVTHDLRNDPLLDPEARAHIPEGASGACVPIRAAADVIGSILIQVAPPRKLSEAEIHLLTTLAEIAGNAIHRTHLNEEIQLRLRRLTALREIDLAIAGSLDLRVTLAIFLDKVTSQLGVDAADIMLLSPQTTLLEYAAGRGFRGRGIEEATIRLGKGVAGRAAIDRRSVFIPDLSEAEGEVSRSGLWRAEGFHVYGCSPLVSRGQVKGVLEVFRREPVGLDPEWIDFLDTLAGQAAIAIEDAQLFDDLQRSNFDLALAYDTTLEGWSRALDLRDRETEGHTQRVTETTLRLARSLGIVESELVHIRRGSLLHDIGKMGVPDHILLKPDKLTEEEWVTMRKHPVYAFEMLSPIAFLRPALDIPYCHHEKWDGTGYPRGLMEARIPLAARIFAVVDVWDALRSDRPYRPAWPDDKVIAHIRDQAGSHFDPLVVAAFLKMLEAET
jgi:putative nucleotidyltransferase with HDIG domain